MRTLSLWSEQLVRPAGNAHLVLFYEYTSSLSNAVALYLADGLGRGEAAVVIETRAHWNEFKKALERRGHFAAALEEEGRLIVKDARETLGSFMRNGMPDADLFRKTLGAVFSLLDLRGHAKVRAYGEMVALLWQDGNYDAAIRLEQLWNELGETRRFSLLCAYRGNSLAPEFHGRPAQAIYREHTHLVPPEDYERLTQAVNLAMDEQFGETEAASLRPIIASSKRRLAVLPGAQASLLWIQSHLPDRIDDVLTSARRHYAHTVDR